MRKLWGYVGMGLAMLLTAGSAGASIILLAHLNIGNEPGILVPTYSDGSARPGGSGEAKFVLNTAQTQMTMFVTLNDIDITGTQTADINDNLTAAHIHAGPALGPPTFPVRWGFFGAPDNDNNPDNLIVTPFATGVGGTFSSVWNQPEGNGGTTLTLQLANLLEGRAYLNFHTRQFGGGEARGTLLVVPEPGSLLLMGLSLGALAFLRRRQR